MSFTPIWRRAYVGFNENEYAVTGDRDLDSPAGVDGNRGGNGRDREVVLTPRRGLQLAVRAGHGNRVGEKRLEIQDLNGRTERPALDKKPTEPRRRVRFR